MDIKTQPQPLLFLSDARGVYIPRDFALCVTREAIVNRTPEIDGDLDSLALGPDQEWYWDTWTDLCDKLRLKDETGEYFLHQDGDLWLVPVGMNWSEKLGFYDWKAEDDGEGVEP